MFQPQRSVVTTNSDLYNRETRSTSALSCEAGSLSAITDEKTKIHTEPNEIKSYKIKNCDQMKRTLLRNGKVNKAMTLSFWSVLLKETFHKHKPPEWPYDSHNLRDKQNRLRLSPAKTFVACSNISNALNSRTRIQYYWTKKSTYRNKVVNFSKSSSPYSVKISRRFTTSIYNYYELFADTWKTQTFAYWLPRQTSYNSSTLKKTPTQITLTRRNATLLQGRKFSPCRTTLHVTILQLVCSISLKTLIENPTVSEHFHSAVCQEARSKIISDVVPSKLISVILCVLCFGTRVTNSRTHFNVKKEVGNKTGLT